MQGAVASVGSSLLRIESPVAGSFATCTELNAAPLADTGIVAEIALIQGDAWFGVTNGTTSLTVYAGHGVLKLTNVATDFGIVAYDPGLMRWWRLRIDRENGQWAADYSADAQTWTLIGTSTFYPVDTPVQIRLGAGDGGKPTPTISDFAGINVCP